MAAQFGLEPAGGIREGGPVVMRSEGRLDVIKPGRSGAASRAQERGEDQRTRQPTQNSCHAGSVAGSLTQGEAVLTTLQALAHRGICKVELLFTGAHGVFTALLSAIRVRGLTLGYAGLAGQQRRGIGQIDTWWKRLGEQQPRCSKPSQEYKYVFQLDLLPIWL